MKCLLSLTVVCALLFSSCSPSKPIDTLGRIVTAAELALPIVLTLVNVPPAMSSAIMAYLHAVSAAVMQSADILTGPTPPDTATKAALVVRAFTGATLPVMGPEVPSAVRTAVATVAAAVDGFLAEVQPKATITGPGGKEGTLKVPPSIELTTTNKRALAGIRSRADELEKKTLAHPR